MKINNKFKLITLSLLFTMFLLLKDSKAIDCPDNKGCYYDTITEECLWWADQDQECHVAVTTEDEGY